MSTPVNTQQPNPSIFKRAAYAVGRTTYAVGHSALKVAEFTGGLVVGIAAGGVAGYGIVNFAEKAYKNRSTIFTSIIARIPTSIIARLPDSMKPKAPEVQQTIIEQKTPKTTPAKVNHARTLRKAFHIGVGILVIGTAAKMACTLYQNRQNPAEYSPPINKSPVEGSPIKSVQENLTAPQNNGTLKAPSPSEVIAPSAEAILTVDSSKPTAQQQTAIELAPTDPIVVPAKPEIALPQAPQPLELQGNKGSIAFTGMSGPEALALIRSGKPLPKGLTLQKFGISSTMVGRLIIRRK